MTPAEQSRHAAEICRLAPVVPVLVIDDLAHAPPLWPEALVAGGLPALEVTLRTPAALDAIRAMAEVPGGVVGAGTLLTPADVKAAKAAGAQLRRLARGHRPAARRLRGRGPAAAARGRHRHRGDGAAGKGLHRAEVLPGRGQQAGRRR